MKIEIRLSRTSVFLYQLQFYFLYFERENQHNLLNEIFYVWKVVIDLSARSMCSFYYIIQRLHCILCFLIWLCFLFMGLYIYIFGFVLLLFCYILRWFGLALFSFHNVLLSFVYELFSFFLGSFSVFFLFDYGLICVRSDNSVTCPSRYVLYLRDLCTCSFNVLFLCVLRIHLFYVLFLCAFLMFSLYSLFASALFMRSFYMLFLCAPFMRYFSCPFFMHSLCSPFMCPLFMLYFNVLFQ